VGDGGGFRTAASPSTPAPGAVLKQPRTTRTTRTGGHAAPSEQPPSVWSVVKTIGADAPQAAPPLPQLERLHLPRPLPELHRIPVIEPLDLGLGLRVILRPDDVPRREPPVRMQVIEVIGFHAPPPTGPDASTGRASEQWRIRHFGKLGSVEGQGDRLAVIADGKLLIFRVEELPGFPRGRCFKLQSYRKSGLKTSLLSRQTKARPPLTPAAARGPSMDGARASRSALLPGLSPHRWGAKKGRLAYSIVRMARRFLRQ